jgi:two-component system OmpR family response regulator
MAMRRSSVLRILVAAGDRALARRLFGHLGQLGHALVAAPDGQTALHLALRDDYDAILLDAALPQLDGFAVCRHLREATRHEVPVIVLTGRGAATDADLTCGADSFLRKPFALSELDSRLDSVAR